MRILFWLGGFLAILFAVLAFGWYVFTTSLPEPVTTPNVTFQPQSSTQLLFDILFTRESQSSRAIVFCQASNNCQPQIIPESENDTPVFDGAAWYRYRSRVEEGTKKTTRVLERVPLKGAPKTIVEETPLVRPQGLFLSPDGKKVAYWLDNITNPAEGMTELWVYDSDRESTAIVAEKLTHQIVVSDPIWNKTATQLWFVTPKNTIQTIATNTTQSVTVAREFPITVDPEALNQHVLDINFDSTLAAAVTQKKYAEGKRVTSTLQIINQQGVQDQASLTGTIPFVSWLPDGSLIYAVTDDLGTSVWRYAEKKHIFIARQTQRVRALHPDTTYNFLMFVSDDEQAANTIAALEIATGKIHTLATLSLPHETAVDIKWAAQQENKDAAAVAGITSKLSDEELVAFVEKNLAAITNESNPQPTKIQLTDEDNSLYVEYAVKGSKGRLLLTVRDAVHTEWSIRARYEAIGSEWQKRERSNLKEPKTTRWYEWEPSVKQWILKTSAN